MHTLLESRLGSHTALIIPSIPGGADFMASVARIEGRRVRYNMAFEGLRGRGLEEDEDSEGGRLGIECDRTRDKERQVRGND
jgi:hypothetical protein